MGKQKLAVITDETATPKKGRQTGTWRYRVACVGTSAILLNPATQDVLDVLQFGSEGTTKKKSKDTPTEDIAKGKLCLGPNGEYGLPSEWLRACLKNAGRYVVYDKKVKMTNAQGATLMTSFLSIVPDLKLSNGDGFIPFTDQEVGWSADRRKGNLTTASKGKGTAVAIIRPLFPKWGFEVSVDIDHNEIDPNKIVELFQKAGKRQGLGDFRPSCGGVFGSFEVTRFKQIEKIGDTKTVEIELASEAA